jgi:hypothetical protein
MSEYQFLVTVAGTPQHAVEELEEACRQLRDDLSNVEHIELSEIPGEPPAEGTRSAVVTVSTAILVAYYGGKIAVMGTRDLKRLKEIVVPALARVFQLWLGRNKETRAIIRLPNGTEADLTNMSEEGIRSILEQFADHSQEPDDHVPTNV